MCPRRSGARRRAPARSGGYERLWSEEFVVNAPDDQVVVGRDYMLDTSAPASSTSPPLSAGCSSSSRVDSPYVVLMGLGDHRAGEQQPQPRGSWRAR